MSKDKGMTGIDAAPIIAEVTGEVFRLVEPGVSQWIRTALFGKTMLVVGPKKAGKTSLVNYLCNGELGDKDIDPGRTEDITPPVKTVLRINKQSLELRIKGLRDLPGQWDPDLQAKKAVSVKPHALVVVLDVNAVLEVNSSSELGTWLDQFLSEYSAKLSLAKNSAAVQRLQEILFVLNKYDELALGQKLGELPSIKKEVKAIVSKHMTAVFGSGSNALPILECILIHNPEDESLQAVVPKLVRRVVVALAQKLASAKNLVD